MFIMVATGTGIAPYRAFLRRMFVEDVPNYRFTGLAWLFMGVANSDAKLYDDEFQEILNTYPDQVRPSSGLGVRVRVEGSSRHWARPRRRPSCVTTSSEEVPNTYPDQVRLLCRSIAFKFLGSGF